MKSVSRRNPKLRTNVQTLSLTVNSASKADQNYFCKTFDRNIQSVGYNQNQVQKYSLSSGQGELGINEIALQTLTKSSKLQNVRTWWNLYIFPDTISQCLDSKIIQKHLKRFCPWRVCSLSKDLLCSLWAQYFARSQQTCQNRICWDFLCSLFQFVPDLGRLYHWASCWENVQLERRSWENTDFALGTGYQLGFFCHFYFAAFEKKARSSFGADRGSRWIRLLLCPNPLLVPQSSH